MKILGAVSSAVSAPIVNTVKNALHPSEPANSADSIIKSYILDSPAFHTRIFGHEEDVDKWDIAKEDSRDAGTPDAWVKRHPDLVRLTGRHPFNGEAPLELLMEAGFLTPAPVHYVCNHGAVPQLSWDTHTVTVEGGPRKHIWSMQQIANMPRRSIPVTLVCAGNRRKEINMLKQSSGFNWGPAGVSTSVWTGVPLYIFLKRCGVTKTSPSRQHVRFRGPLGELSEGDGSYGTSIPLEMALNPACDCMIAYEQNGRRLHPDHGYPVRLIVPGWIGGRMVKWLSHVEVSAEPSDNYYHYHHNRILPPHVDIETAKAEGWWFKPKFIFNELNINSVITSPAHEESIEYNPAKPDETYTVKGYCYTGGGRMLTRVEISLDAGTTWQFCTLKLPERPNEHGRRWCWGFWSCKVLRKDLAGAAQLCCRAWDESNNTQPRDLTWNLMGMGNNCYFRLKAQVRQASWGSQYISYTQPTLPGPLRGGWMGHVPGEWKPETAALPLPALPPLQTDNGTTVEPPTEGGRRMISMAEVKKHSMEDNCWVIVNGKVYNPTNFIPDHPGGEKAISLKGGTDVTEKFIRFHSKNAWTILERWYIGDLEGAAEGEASTSIPSSEPAISSTDNASSGNEAVKSVDIQKNSDALESHAVAETAAPPMPAPPLPASSVPATPIPAPQPAHASVGSVVEPGKKADDTSTQAALAVVEPVKTGGQRIISKAEFEQHNREDDCWVVVKGKVYDPTRYIPDHPGGVKAISLKAGTDVTEKFVRFHSKKAWGILEQWYIGDLEDGTSVASIPAPVPAISNAVASSVLEPTKTANANKPSGTLESHILMETAAPPKPGQQPAHANMRSVVETVKKADDTSAQPVPTAIEPSKTVERRLISKAEFEQHCREDDCWVVVKGKVYDPTRYIPDHPGGVKAISLKAGTDVTEKFVRFHSKKAWGILEQWYIGDLEDSASNTSISAAVPAIASNAVAPGGVEPVQAVDVKKPFDALESQKMEIAAPDLPAPPVPASPVPAPPRPAPQPEHTTVVSVVEPVKKAESTLTQPAHVPAKSFKSGGGPTISMAEVEKHSLDDDCWIVVDGKVYDPTKYLQDHPGGGAAILINAGTDVTEEFEAIHSKNAWTVLEKMYIGDLEGAAESEDTSDLVVTTRAMAGAYMKALDGSASKLTVTLKERIVVNHNTRIFRFALPSDQHILGLPVGQHVYLSSKVDKKLVVRPYTPKGDGPGYFDLLIKVYFKNVNRRHPEGGVFTQHLESLKIGDTVDVKGPIGRVLYEGSGHYTVEKKPFHCNKLGMIAGGTGITPMWQIIYDICKNPDDTTEVFLIFANKSWEDLLLFDELSKLEKVHPQLHVWHTLANVPFDRTWEYSKGFVTEGMCRAHLPKPGRDTSIFLCGPSAMLKHACYPALETIGHKPDRIVAF